jgi:hypothetical protein
MGPRICLPLCRELACLLCDLNHTEITVADYAWFLTSSAPNRMEVGASMLRASPSWDLIDGLILLIGCTGALSHFPAA